MKLKTGAGAVQPAAQAPAWRRHVAPLALLWAATLLAYSNSFHGGLIYDSAARILQDPRVQSADSRNLALIVQNDYWYPALGTGLYRPLTTLSFLFNYAILGNQGHPEGYHILNWILHSVNVSLVYLLAWLLLGETLWAAMAAGLWGVHPVLTESVTNVVGRSDLLAGIGVLGGLLCYILATRSEGRRRWQWLALAAVAVGIGIFSKESAIVVLPVLVLYEMAFGSSTWKDRLKRCAVPAAPCLLYGLARYPVFAHAAPAYIPFVDNPIAHSGFLAGKWTAIKVIGKQLLLLAWPARLSCDYSYNQIPTASWADWGAWTALIACMALAAAAAICYRRNRMIFFWIGFSALALAPTANIFKNVGTEMAERFLYLPAVGFSVCLAAALRRMPKNRGYAVAAVLVAAYGARTYARNLDWQDHLSLWRSAAAASPDSYQTHASLAIAVPLEEALVEIGKATAILDALPDEINNAGPYVTAGQKYREKGDYGKSLQLLLRAKQIQRTHIDRIRRDLQLSGGNSFRAGWSPVYEELAKTYRNLGQPEKEVESLRESLELRSTPETVLQLSGAYYKSGDHRGAAVALLEGLAVEPRNPRMTAALLALYSEMDPNGCSVQAAQGGGQAVNFACPAVHEDACTAYRDLADRYTTTGEGATARQVRQYASERLGCETGQ
jgi:tetratricopeptide (TPR) repeat protein